MRYEKPLRYEHMSRFTVATKWANLQEKLLSRTASLGIFSANQFETVLKRSTKFIMKLTQAQTLIKHENKSELSLT